MLLLAGGDQLGASCDSVDSVRDRVAVLSLWSRSLCRERDVFSTLR